MMQLFLYIGFIALNALSAKGNGPTTIGASCANVFTPCINASVVGSAAGAS